MSAARAKSEKTPKRDVTLEQILAYGLDYAVIAKIRAYLTIGSMDRVARDLLKFFQIARSYTEHEWTCLGEAMIEERMQARVIFAGYEWFTLKIPGGVYTPDWCYLLADGRWVMVELKNNPRQPGYDEARVRQRAAAALNPWFTFFEVCKKNSRGEVTWRMEPIEPDKFLLDRLNLETAWKEIQ